MLILEDICKHDHESWITYKGTRSPASNSSIRLSSPPVKVQKAADDLVENNALGIIIEIASHGCSPIDR